MSATEEQEQELEVLESIYPDELNKISDTEFTIQLSLEEPNVDVDAEGYEAPTILLRVTYTPKYPEEAPVLAFSLPSSDHPLTFPEDEEPLQAALDTAVEENMGMAMVFTLTTTLKEAAETILRSRAEEAQRVRDEVARIEEEKEMEKFRGELVTKEVFEKWREAFLKEQKEKKEAEDREREEAEAKSGKKSGNTSGVGLGGKKLTGRDLFERGLAGGVDDDDDGEDEETPDVAKLEIKA
ncbi:hypothetical protein H072_9707 [Dactylellina haptotyla CBS 200.50]|uniref:RWD domain-containing protein n=1 Tax=Dactylellina haptotyla (strain CBS 200.50) TaxID=1284197 RepID=S8A6H2_DACHA|nr:hypothetical protein H072_9707 [Dactylellina haptotyla CBS 200.50]